MNRITEQGKNASTVLMGIILLTGVIAFAASPQIAYSTHLGPITVSSPNDEIEKTVSIEEETDDGIITVGERIVYTIEIDVENNSPDTWSDVEVKDRFAGNLAVGDSPVTTFLKPADQVDTIDSQVNLDCALSQKGKTQKEFLDCVVDDGLGDQDLSPGETASVEVTAETDFNHGQGKKNPIGQREYTSCGEHDVNSGATVTYTLPDGTIVEASTDSVTVDVFEFADLSGDCDQDGIPDSTDAEPFEFNDADGDGVGDGFDICPGFDDAADLDVDGTPDGCDVDADGDTYEGVLGDGMDCNDLDANINPGAVDDTVDGIDQNCDGVDGQ